MLPRMALDAIALLRLPASDMPPDAVLRSLEDAVLVRTGAPFAAEPTELARALRRAAGDALDRHRDPRGVLFLPDVARPQGCRYDDVVEEIGEGGTWLSRAEAMALGDEDDEDEGGDGDLLASMMQAMASPEMQSAMARARDAGMGAQGGAERDHMLELARSMTGASDPDGALPAEREMRALVERHAPGASADAEMPVDLGALMGDPAFQQMIDDVRSKLLSDPDKVAELQSLFGLMDAEDDDDDEEGGAPSS
jgi:hypothetical protein